jgi:hypothetical protein
VVHGVSWFTGYPIHWVSEYRRCSRGVVVRRYSVVLGGYRDSCRRSSGYVSIVVRGALGRIKVLSLRQTPTLLAVENCILLDLLCLPT